MAVQTNTIITNLLQKTEEQKNCNFPGAKEFKDYLENIRNTLEKPLSKENKQKYNLLIQLLNVLNMNRFVDNYDNIIDLFLPYNSMNIDNSEWLIEHTENELIQCWQDVLLEFEATGNIRQDTLSKFYITMKQVSRETLDLDLDKFHIQINELLKKTTSPAKSEQIKNTEKHTLVTHQTDYGKNIVADKSKHFRTDNINDNFDVRTKSMNQKVIGQNSVSNDVKFKQHLVLADHDISESVNFHGFSLLTAKEPFIDLNQVGSNDILSTTNFNPAEVFDQIIDKVYLALIGEKQQVSIRLKPEHLGNVLIKVSAVRDKIQAQFFVENTQVRNMIRMYANDFKNQIQQQGYNFSEIAVYNLSDGLETGTFNHWFDGDNNHSQSQRSRVAFNTNDDDENQGKSVERYYEGWGNDSSINYIV